MSKVVVSRLFSAWFGWGLPLFLGGAVIIGFITNLWLGLGLVAALLGWIYSLGSTTCRGCASFGTARCGLPGLVVPLVWSKSSPASVPVWRVRLQYGIDVVMLFLLNAVYLLCLPLLPLALFWSAVTWWLVIRPKRFHGQYHRLQDQRAAESSSLVSLPVLAPVSGEKPECGAACCEAVKGD